MRYQIMMVCVWVLLAAGVPPVSAEGIGPDDVVRAMKKELALTPEQVAAVKPILKEYLTARGKYLESIEGAPIINRKEVAATMKELKEKQRAKLSKVLDKQQMAKWTNRENLRARMNSGVTGFQTDDGTTVSTNGANFNF